MLLKKSLLFVASLYALVGCCFAFTTKEDSNEYFSFPNLLLSRLASKVKSSQVKRDSRYIPGPSVVPPISEEKYAGLWPSHVHLNFWGENELKLMRNKVIFFDNNYFVTAWMMHVLLEITEYDIVSSSEFDESMLNAAKALNTHFHDQNYNDSIPAIMFWPEKLNKTSGVYTATTRNIAAPVEILGSQAELIHKSLDALGLDKFWEIIAPFLTMSDMFLSAFGIPADFDDTSVNLGLAGDLLRLKDLYPSTTKTFFEDAKWNQYPNHYAELVVKYAYKPYSTDVNNNYIDPRTYYWIRHFIKDYSTLQKELGIENPSISLITTWESNYEDNQKMQDKDIYYRMPFMNNNVDASVVANSIYGITSRIISDPEGAKIWFTRDLEQTYLDSVHLLTWVVTSGWIGERADLLLLYYPPVNDFFWFVSRSIRIMRKEKDIVSKFPSMVKAASLLEDCLSTHGTRFLLDRAKSESGFTFWDDFIGNNDTHKSFDDRMFTTSMALNALLNIWTETSGKTLRFLPEIDEETKEAITASALFLKKNVFSTTYKKENAFFSGSFKTIDMLPYAYPYNYFVDVNKKVKPVSDVKLEDVVLGCIAVVTGVVEEDEYEKLIEAHPTEQVVPTTFKGYNTEIFFPYWSSEELTDGLILLALGKTNQLL